MIRRLRIKFICINMAIVTAMLLVIFGMVLHFTRENLEKQSMGILQSVIADRGLPGRFGDRREVQLPWFRVSRTPTGEQRILSNGYDEQLGEEVLREVVRQASDSEEQRGLMKNYQLRFSKIPGPFGEEIIFVDISSEIATMQSLLTTCIWVGILSFGVFLLLSILLARWAIRPVAEAWDQQRQFVADASHELKTPLTVIMTNAELMQDPTYDEDARRGFAESILTMSAQMRFLVESLLDLARLDNGMGRMQLQQTDLSGIVEESVMLFEPVYFERQLELESELEEGLRIRGSGSHLKQVLDILLDNGAKYTTPGGRVRVTLRRQGSHCLLAVAGSGEAISRDDLKKIFKRFYRTDKARTRDGSYGLGLAIAEGIVAEHNGRIWAESDKGINTFFVQLPLL